MWLVLCKYSFEVNSKLIGLFGVENYRNIIFIYFLKIERKNKRNKEINRRSKCFFFCLISDIKEFWNKEIK